ncbi:MAG: PorT family protein [Leptolyngbya sp. SIO3F4]|nr:PorT family protein [Leptolyngbya sp. SIO3F4]
MVSVQAQNDSTRWSIGILAGVNGSDYSDSSDFEFNPRYTFMTGVQVVYDLMPSLAVEADVLYVNRKFGYTVIAQDVNGNDLQRGEFNTELRYISIPLFLRYSYGERWKVYGGAGPEVNFLLLAQQRYGDDVFRALTRQGFDGQQNTNVSRSYETVYLGINGQAGVQAPITDMISVDLGVRYGVALTNLSDDSDARFNGFQFLAGLQARF